VRNHIFQVLYNIDLKMNTNKTRHDKVECDFVEYFVFIKKKPVIF